MNVWPNNILLEQMDFGKNEKNDSGKSRACREDLKLSWFNFVDGTGGICSLFLLQTEKMWKCKGPAFLDPHFLIVRIYVCVYI